MKKFVKWQLIASLISLAIFAGVYGYTHNVLDAALLVLVAAVMGLFELPVLGKALAALSTVSAVSVLFIVEIGMNMVTVTTILALGLLAVSITALVIGRTEKISQRQVAVASVLQIILLACLLFGSYHFIGPQVS
ncbi:MAG: hypothetical protein ACPGO5_04650 [Patescibacteria group bacterium]